MTSPLSLGIDLGTTSVKVAALTAAGELVGGAASHHGIDEHAGGVQADPAVWWASVLRALSDLGDQVDLARVCTVGLSGNMSSVVLVDEAHRPLGPALLLADARGADEISRLPDEIRGQILEATGNEPGTVFALSSLLWWREHHLETIGCATAWLSAKDYLRLGLTGHVATDPTDAYNSLLLRDGQWDDALIAAVGLERRIFPQLVASDAVAGRLHAQAGAVTGLPAGVPVATGSGDVAAALAGMGGLPTGTLAVSLGTSVTLMAALGDGPRPSLPQDAQGAMTVHPAADGSWFALGSLLTGGLALNWLRSLVGSEALADVSPDPDPGDLLTFLPYLAGTGSPDYVPTATGTILGITPSTTAAQLVGALLEAVAFDLAGLVDRLGGQRWSRVIVSGGGGRIAAWPQVIADILGTPVDVLDQPDLSALGAAVLGWRAVGDAVSPALTTQTFAQRSANVPAWDVRRRRYELARGLALDLTRKILATQREASA